MPGYEIPHFIIKKSKQRVQCLKKKQQNSLSKNCLLLIEIADNLRMGKGKPKRLKYQSEEVWSRRIDKKNRLIYVIKDEVVVVVIVSLMGHYEDK